MKAKMLWKDAWQAITHSWGRYLAIAFLIALGTFAFIGLKMTGPDMRATGSDFFRTHNLADITVTSNYGLNRQDQRTIKALSGVKQTEFGYLQDVTVQKPAATLRLLSNSPRISSCQLISGHWPKGASEIALSYLLKDKFRLGQTIKVRHGQLLKQDRLKIVGFVRSSEYLDKHQLGQTTIGDGQLSGIGITAPAAFSSPVYQLARVNFVNTAGLSPFSIKYRNLAYHDQERLQTALDQNRTRKWQALQRQAQAQARQKLLAPLQPKQIQLALQAQLPLKTKLHLAYPEYTVSARENNLGYATYRADSQKVEILANVFPIFLYAVAALVCLSTMMRFVEEERIKIGTLKGLGYSNLAVALKFTLYSSSAALLGVGLGSLLGYTFLPNMIIRAYLASSTMGSNYELNFAWWPLVICLAVALVSTTLVTWLTLWQTLSERPAALLLPKPPKNGARILLEYIQPLWKHLSFSAKVTARNIFRYKSRMLMTILGVAGCTGLLVMGFGIRDSLKGISQIQYGQIQRHDLIALEKPALSQPEKQKIAKFMHRPAIKRSLPVRCQQLTKHLPATGATQTISLIVPQNPEELAKFIKLRRRTDHHQLSLPEHGVVISEKLANLLHVQAGDWISLKVGSQTKHFKINGICEMYINHYLFMSPAAYRFYWGKAYQPNAYLVTVQKKGQVDAVSRQLLKLPGLQTIVANSATHRFLNSYTGSIDTVIIILIVISSLLAVAVIYNLTNINVAERIRELSTIKVLGFYDLEVTMYIYRETIILSLLGILVGFACGWWLHQFIILNLPPDQAMFDPKLYPLNFLISACIPAAITGLMAIWVHHHLQRINMLDALSSLD